MAQGFVQLLKPDNNFAHVLEQPQYDQFRSIVVDMILTTDLAHHLDFVSHFKHQSVSGELAKDSQSSRTMRLQMALKCADVGHTARTPVIHNKWSSKIVEEFYLQGDEERTLGLPVSPFMDRKNPNVARSQLSFIEFLVLPMFEAWDALVVADRDAANGNNNNDDDDDGDDDDDEEQKIAEEMPCLRYLKQNRDRWEAEVQKEDEVVRSKSGRSKNNKKKGVVGRRKSTLRRKRRANQ